MPGVKHMPPNSIRKLTCISLRRPCKCHNSPTLLKGWPKEVLPSSKPAALGNADIH